MVNQIRSCYPCLPIGSCQSLRLIPSTSRARKKKKKHTNVSPDEIIIVTLIVDDSPNLSMPILGYGSQFTTNFHQY